jgi:hypothetical protein
MRQPSRSPSTRRRASSSRPGGSVSSMPSPSPKQWRSLQRWIGPRDCYAQTHLAVAGLVSDRATRR